MSNKALIIFTRNPELGKCKTRLAKSIGDEEALKVYKELLQHTANVAKKVNAYRYAYYSVKIRENDIWTTGIFNKKQQFGQDLGQRMENAFQECFNANHDKVIIIGSDLLDLSEDIIEEAYKKLDDNDAVIGPAEDGGYYLLGLKNPFPEVFNIKNWGTETVYKQTLEKLFSKKVYVLKTLNDIDHVEDLHPYPRFASYFKKTNTFIMKTKLLLLLVSIFSSMTFYGQCSRSGTFVANSPDTMVYPIQGTANITQTASGMTVNFEGDFISVQGFKLAVYLSTTQTINTNPISNPNPTTFIRVDQDGDLLDDEHNSAAVGHNEHPMSGAKTFNQNLASVNLNDYQYIILQCIEFHVPWGYANLGANSTGCVLSVEDNTFENQINFAPNPTSENITISNKNNLDLSITVVDLLGKAVIKTKRTNLRNQEINLQSLKTGVYLLQITSNGKSVTKKLIKK